MSNGIKGRVLAPMQQSGSCDMEPLIRFNVAEDPPAWEGLLSIAPGTIMAKRQTARLKDA
eukprot:1060488-Amphidinium_carterae.1